MLTYRATPALLDALTARGSVEARGVTSRRLVRRYLQVIDGGQAEVEAGGVNLGALALALRGRDLEDVALADLPEVVGRALDGEVGTLLGIDAAEQAERVRGLSLLGRAYVLDAVERRWAAAGR